MPHILIIDDTNDHRDNLSEILLLKNYSVTTAENGVLGIKKALQELPDLIVCDVRMPIMDGFSVLNSIRNNQQTANIPFVFLTALAEKNEIAKGLEMGADDFITKPFDISYLLGVVERQLLKSRVHTNTVNDNTFPPNRSENTNLGNPFEWLNNLALSLEHRYARPSAFKQQNQSAYESCTRSNRIFLT
jgi:DNA-binding response OmpR family regulator